MENFKVLISEEQLQKRMEELARQIEKDYEGKEITVVCVMNGAIFFTVQLTLKIKNAITYEFIQLASYGESTETSGNIVMKKDLENSIEGKDVLIVEDIIDTGRTLNFLKKHLKDKGANSVKICVLTSKPERREVDVDVDYIGFEIPNKFVVGYGFDIGGKYRNIPYVAYIEE